jgi:hypothetical protein
MDLLDPGRDVLHRKSKPAAEGNLGLRPRNHLARRLAAGGEVRLQSCREHGLYGTVEIELEFPAGNQASDPSGQPTLPTTYLLDVATARQEHYPVPGENPVVRFGSLDDDLARRDFSINAMALVFAFPGPGLRLLDPHGGGADLRLPVHRQLRPGHPARGPRPGGGGRRHVSRVRRGAARARL